MYQVHLEHIKEQLGKGRFKRKHNKKPGNKQIDQEQSYHYSNNDLVEQWYQYQAWALSHTIGHIHYREQ